MSFLYDPGVYNKIIKVLNKTAQDNTVLSPNAIAKKLVNKLSRDFAGVHEAINISSNTSTPIALGTDQLQSLSKLLQFLASGQIKLDNIRIAYTANEMENLPEEEKNILSPVTTNISRDAVTRKWNTADFYTNLPTLIKYVHYLQQKANDLKKTDAAQGKILEVMVGKLVDSINTIKPDSGLLRRPKSTPGKPNEIPEETVIDTYGNKILDIKNPYADQGSVGLLAKNLLTRESLNFWLQGGGETGPEAQIVMYDSVTGQPKVIRYSSTSPEPNLCFVVNVLYLRAQRLLRMSKSPEETKKYNFYLNKINQLGPTFTDPQGKACAIVGQAVVMTSGTQHAGFSFLGRPGEGVGQGESSKVSLQILEQLVQSLPLDTEEIDFNRIKNFFSQYTKIVSRDNSSAAFTAIGVALTAMAEAVNRTLTGNQQSFRLTRNVEELQTWLKVPTGNNALPFLYALQQVISETGKVIKMFYNEYARTLYSGDRQVFNNEQKSLVEGQILGSNSIYSQNLEEIQSLMANVKSILSSRK